MRLLTFLWPTRLALVFFVVLALLFSIFPLDIHATTKITWEEAHGWPFRFLQLSVCFSVICSSPDYFVLEFDAWRLVLDAVLWYLLACLAAYGLPILLRNKKIRAIVTAKR